MGQVMIVEDSQALRKIMEVLLRREEIDTESYADGYTALRALQDPKHAIPAVVLLDLGLPPAKNLPAIDGYAFARLLRSQLRFDSVVIIVLSGHDDMVTRVRARLAGARAYLSKPFKMQQLLALIRQHLILPAEAEEEAGVGCASGAGPLDSVGKTGQGHHGHGFIVPSTTRSPSPCGTSSLYGVPLGCHGRS